MFTAETRSAQRLNIYFLHGVLCVSRAAPQGGVQARAMRMF
jgi:hypothetical protein